MKLPGSIHGLSTQILAVATRLGVAAAMLTLAACSSGGDSGATPSAEGDGEVVIGLTDAEDDFLSYTIDIKSLTLTRNDGAVVETLPLTTRVDFAQYTELTEFLTAATVPSGIYTSAQMLVDYTDAQIVVQDAAGEAIEATAKDSAGNPIGELEMDVRLSDSDTFRIAPGIPAHVTLDFDLEASNEIVFDADPVEVIVDPVLIADTLLESPKEHRLRGLLQRVSLDASAFTIAIRPFHHRVGRFGSLRVTSLDDTAYEIDGESFTGAEGLAKLAEMPTTTAVVVHGELNLRERRFEAEQVYAGTSVPWGDKDLLSGHVVARTGDTLTVRGATVLRSNDRVLFNDDVTVLIGTETKITKQGGGNDGLNKDDVSVGQRVSVSGSITDSANPTIDANVTIDATEGHVRMLYTTLRADVNQANPLIVNLQAIGGRRVSIFHFSGTGVSPDTDADPANYEIDTGSLPLSSITANDPVKIRGFVNGFGQAPADFNAQTVLNVKNLPALMAIAWEGEGTTAPFTSQSASEIVVNLTNTQGLSDLHHVFRAGVATDLLSFGVDPSIVPDDQRRGVYAIAQNRVVHVFFDFARFEAALANRLDGVTSLSKIHSRGRFDDAQVQQSTHRMSVRLH